MFLRGINDLQNPDEYSIALHSALSGRGLHPELVSFFDSMLPYDPNKSMWKSMKETLPFAADMSKYIIRQ